MIFKEQNKLISLAMIPFQYEPLLSVLTLIKQLLDALVPVLNVIIIADFIDTANAIFTGKAAKADIYLPAFLLIILLAFQILAGAVFGFVTRKMNIRLNDKIKLDCITRQASFDYEYIDRSESLLLAQRVLGDLPARIAAVHSDFLSAASLILRVAGILFVFITCGMLWGGVLILLVSVPMIGITYKNGRKIYQFYKENFPGQMEMYHSTYILKERSLAGERTLFGFSEIMNRKWKSMQMDLYMKKKQVNKKILRNRFAVRFLNLACAAAILSYLAYGLTEHIISAGLFISLTTNILLLIEQVMTEVMGYANRLAQEKEFLADFNQVCQFRVNSDELLIPSGRYDKIHTIEFRNVEFTYPGTEHKALNGVSFIIREGRHYAFVGKNGAGKSTIIKLLSGLYNNYSGDILINGKNLRDYSPQERKAMMGILYQDSARYELSLKQNVEIGDINKMLQNGTPDAFNEALHAVGLTCLREQLPRGADTLLGKTEENGQDVSGGEWQRIAIARLLYKDTGFMVLDEPAASLDPMAESRLYQLFSDISRNRTTLLISHRLGSVKGSDYIFVVEEGIITEEGSHESLLALKGLYHAMYQEQKGWYQ